MSTEPAPAPDVDPNEPRTALGLFLGHTPARRVAAAIQLVGYGFIATDLIAGTGWPPMADACVYASGTGLVFFGLGLGIRRKFVGPTLALAGVAIFICFAAYLVALSPFMVLSWLAEPRRRDPPALEPPASPRTLTGDSRPSC